MKSFKCLAWCLINISYHDEDNDSDNSSYYLMVIYYLPGAVQLFDN